MTTKLATSGGIAAHLGGIVAEFDAVLDRKDFAGALAVVVNALDAHISRVGLHAELAPKPQRSAARGLKAAVAARDDMIERSGVAHREHFGLQPRASGRWVAA